MSVPRDEPTVEVWQEAYGITFTDTELRLLTAAPGLLTTREIQHAYLLKMALRPEQCPACKFVLSERSAWTGPLFNIADHGDGRGYACSACGAELIHRQGLDISEHWMELAPDQIVRIYGPESM